MYRFVQILRKLMPLYVMWFLPIVYVLYFGRKIWQRDEVQISIFVFLVIICAILTWLIWKVETCKCGIPIASCDCIGIDDEEYDEDDDWEDKKEKEKCPSCNACLMKCPNCGAFPLPTSKSPSYSEISNLRENYHEENY